MKVKWEVEDGYVGKARPHYTEVPDDELDGLDKAGRDDLIEYYVEEDFRQSVWFHWKTIE